MIHSASNQVPDTPQTYRLYRLEALSGEIRSVENLTAFSDGEATGQALAEASDDRIELGREGRKLAAISGSNGPAELAIAPPEE